MLDNAFEIVNISNLDICFSIVGVLSKNITEVEVVLDEKETADKDIKVSSFVVPEYISTVFPHLAIPFFV